VGWGGGGGGGGGGEGGEVGFQGLGEGVGLCAIAVAAHPIR
jgi:hypothetical protein